MPIDATVVLHTLSQYLWPFVRISAVIMSVPFLSGKMIPMRIRLILSIALTMVIAPTIAILPSSSLISYSGFILLTQQVLIGVAIGFVFQLVVQTFILCGQIISMQSGLGFASMIDPTSGVSVPLIAQLFMFITGLLFFSFNFHLLLIETIANSFQTLPISDQGLSTVHYMSIVNLLSSVIGASMLLALPVVFSLLLVNLGLGVLSRAAPQLNIFSIGFPITLTMSILLVYLLLGNLTPHVQNQFEFGFSFINEMLSGKVA